MEVIPVLPASQLSCDSPSMVFVPVNATQVPMGVQEITARCAQTHHLCPM